MQWPRRNALKPRWFSATLTQVALLCCAGLSIVLLTAWPADAMTDAELGAWLTSTTRLDVLSHGPDSSIPHRFVRVRGTDVAGYLVPEYVTHGFVSNGQEVLVIPIASGGSMGVNSALVFTPYSGRRRFVGYIPGPQGHLSISITEGSIETSSPIYLQGDANCCPSRSRVTTFRLTGIRLTRVSENVTAAVRDK
jgi:hypothetical protein